MDSAINIKLLRRIGLRWVLSAFFTVIHLVLIFLPSIRHKEQTSFDVQENLEYHVTAYQEGIPWRPAHPQALPTPKRIAVIISLPAVLVAVPVTAVLFHGNEMNVLCVSALLVPLLWFFVGRWLDIRLGFLPQSRSHNSLFRRIGRGIAVVLLTLLFALSLQTYFQTRAEVSGIAEGFLFWSGLIALMALLNFLHHRNSPAGH